MANNATVICQRFIKSRPTVTSQIVLASTGSIFGYTSGVGSFASGLRGVMGLRISWAASRTSVYDLLFTLTADSANHPFFTTGVPQDFLSALILDDAGGTPVSYDPAVATYSFTGIGATSWQWGDGSSLLWSGADSGETKKIRMVR